MHTQFTLAKTKAVLDAITEQCAQKVRTHILQNVVPGVLKQVEAEIDQVVATYLTQITIRVQEDPVYNNPTVQFVFPEVTKEKPAHD